MTSADLSLIPLRRVLAAALAVAVLDAAFGIVHCRVANDVCTAAAFFRGIASFAPTWFPGYRTSVLGALLHLGVATFWTSAYAASYQRSRTVQRAVASAAGTAAVATLLGAFIWLVMDLLVLPVLGSGRHTPVDSRAFWVLLAGHPVFVGLPITTVVRRTQDRS